MRLGCFLTLLLGLLYAVSAEKAAGSFKVSATQKDNRVHYITKFACSIGECRYNVRAGIRQPFALLAWTANKLGNPNIKTNYEKLQDSTPAKMVVRVVLDDEWETSHDMAACDRAELGRGRTTISVPLNGTIGPWATNTFRQTYRPHFWYFFAEDCRNSITAQLAKAAGVKPEDFNDYEIYYEMEIYQVGGSHLSFEYMGMIKWNVVQLVAYTALLGWMINKQQKVMKNQRFKLHVMSQILNAAVIGSIWGTLLHIMHLWKVDHTGYAFPLLDGFADTSFMLSQVAVSSCLILISLGVTLNAPERMPMALLGVLGAAVAFAHMLVVFIDKYAADVRFKYYASEGPIGWILIAFRIALWGLFLVCWQTTRTDPRTPAATDRFLRRMLLPASAYFLTFPMLLLLTSLFKPYWRHAAFFHLTFLVHLGAIFGLAELFLNKGEYFKVSTMSQSFLPGGVWRPTVAPHHID